MPNTIERIIKSNAEKNETPQETYSRLNLNFEEIGEELTTNTEICFGAISACDGDLASYAMIFIAIGAELKP